MAYFSIPLLLLNRQHIAPQIRPVLLLFAAFIFSCGIRVWNIWHANYWLEGGWSWITATISLYTAWQLKRTVAEVLRRHIRAVDLAARVGGDEFALLLVGCPLPEAKTKVELVRQQIEAIHLPDLGHPGTCPLVSASMGISELSLDRGLVYSYQQADTALYRAKQGGKNQIQVAVVFPAVAE